MADQKCSKMHISAVIPPIMKIFSPFFIFQRARILNLNILLKYEIQYGGYKLSWTPEIYISLRLY